MLWKFIIPPPNTTAFNKFFIADSTHHPNNTPGAMLLKQSGVDLSDSCCCQGGDACCFFDACASVPATIFITLSGFGCLLDDTWTLTLQDCTEEGDHVSSYTWGVSQVVGNCIVSINIFCNNPGASQYSCQITVNDTISGNETRDWGMYFNIISCDPLSLESFDFTSNGFTIEGETEACDCFEPDPASPSGTVTE